MVDRRDSRHLIAGISVGGVYVSRDGGETWQARNRGLYADYLPDPHHDYGHDPHIILASPSNPDVLWQQNHCGIYRSENGGLQWKDISENEGPAGFGFALALDAQDERVAMAALMNDDDFAAECADWLKRGKAAYQDKLWTGEYYRLWHDPANTSGEGPDCDVSLGNQLMAQWCVKIAGLPDILPAEQIQSAMGAVKRLNMAATEHGLVNGVNPDGTRHVSKLDPDAHRHILPNYEHGRQVFVAENLCAAMNFIYHGQRETGLEIARRLYEAVALTARSPWKQYCMIDADSGLPVWGEDYYSNMVIWALPMACTNQNIAEFVGGELLRELNDPPR